MYKLNISEKAPVKVYRLLVLTGTALTGIYVFLSIIIRRPAHSFNLDSESNIPAWFSTIQYLILGFILLSENIHRQGSREITRKFLRLAGAGFIFLSLDEAAGVHETFGNVMKNVSGKETWVILYAIIGLGILVWGRKAIYELHSLYKSEFWIAAAGFLLLFFGGGILEKIGSVIPRNTDLDLMYKTEVVFEELFEMIGVSTLIFSALKILLKTQSMHDNVIPKTKSENIQVN